jgi:glycosyl transferase/beta-hydroxylase protein BlmF
MDNYEIKVKHIVGPRLVLSQLWNIAYEKLATGTIIMHCGDDVMFRTVNWDEEVYKAYMEVPDKILLVFGNDGIAADKCATHSFVSRKWIEVSGMWLPPYFVSDFNDVWLDEVARKIDRIKYIPKLYFEHMHFIAQKAVKDKNTNERLKRHQQNKPEQIYKTTAPERDHHAATLLKYMHEFK